MRGLAVGLLIVLATGVAHANPSLELPRARAQFEHGEYQRVIDTLGPQLYPTALIRDEDELEEAHYLLGSAQFYLGHKDLARQEFSALLFLNPNKELDAATESPEVYAFFSNLKKELADKLEAIRIQKAREEAEKNRPSREIVIERIVHDPSFLPNFIPFGYPQFRNGQPLKGYLFMGAQALFAGTSLSLFMLQAFQYGLPSHNVPAEDASALRTRQVIQVGTGAVALVAYLWSMADGFANQKPKIEEKRSERPLTQPPPKPKPTGLIVPIVGPSTVGIGAVWRF